MKTNGRIEIHTAKHEKIGFIFIVNSDLSKVIIEC